MPKSWKGIKTIPTFVQSTVPTTAQAAKKGDIWVRTQTAEKYQFDGTDWYEIFTGQKYYVATIGESASYGPTQLWGAGYNTYGQIGNNSSSTAQSWLCTDSTYSTVNVSCTGWSTLFIKSNGTLWTMGRNVGSAAGILGDNTIISKSSPIQIGQHTNWSQISGTLSSAFAIKTDGTLWAWGGNTYGECGQSNTTLYSSPVQIGGTTWSCLATSAGYVSDTIGAIKTDGTLWAWGRNTGGQCGQNTTSPTVVGYSSPTQVGSSTKWVKVSQGGNYFMLGVQSDGTLWGWGNNTGGQLGTNDVTAKSVPTQIGTGTKWKYIRGGYDFSIATQIDGTLWAWGSNGSGSLGQGNTNSVSSPIQIGTDTKWSIITSGFAGSVAAIKTDGTLWTWGSNGQYDLGLGNIINYSSPVQVGIQSNWKYVTKSQYGFMALKDGDVQTAGLFIWGYNGHGETGLNSTTSVSAPTGLGSYSAFAGGQDTTYFLKSDGTLWATGLGNSGWLGNNSTMSRSSPIQIGTNSDWSVIGGPCAIKTNGTLWSWGSNGSGQIGDNTIVDKSSPVQIGTDTTWKSVIFDHGQNSSKYALKTDSTAWAWGANGWGQLGQNDAFERSSPVQIAGTWKKVIGRGTTIGIKTNGTLWVWGRNSYGEHGLNDIGVSRSSPVQVGSLTTWAECGVGMYCIAAIKTDGTLWTCGQNDVGQLGLGDNTWRSSPTQVGSLTTWTKIGCGYGFGALRSDGSMWTWGWNGSYYFLGDGTSIDRNSPVQIGQDKTWTDIVGYYRGFGALTGSTQYGGLWYLGGVGVSGMNNSTSYSSPVQIGTDATWITLAGTNHYAGGGIKTDGTLWMWGENNHGQTGDNTTTDRLSPVQIGTDTKWLTTGGGDWYKTAVKTDGTLWSWGRNTSGQLGKNDTVERSSPTQVGTDTTWKTLCRGSGNNTGCIKTNGTLWTWGTNGNGELGDNTTVNKSSPVQIGTDTKWSVLTSSGWYNGAGSMFAIKTDGTLWTWGYGTYGISGLNNATTSYSSPVQIGTDANWSNISSYEVGRVLALKTDGTMWTWGYNAYGYLGDNTLISRSSPTQIGGYWKKISVGYTGSAAIRSDGTLWTWGTNGSGELGLNNQINISSPTQVGSANNWKSIDMGTYCSWAIR